MSQALATYNVMVGSVTTTTTTRTIQAVGPDVTVQVTTARKANGLGARFVEMTGEMFVPVRGWISDRIPADVNKRIWLPVLSSMVFSLAQLRRDVTLIISNENETNTAEVEVKGLAASKICDFLREVDGLRQLTMLVSSEESNKNKIFIELQ